MNADMTAIPRPLPDTIKISTNSRRLLKYWATISVEQSRVMPTPIPVTVAQSILILSVSFFQISRRFPHQNSKQTFVVFNAGLGRAGHCRTGGSIGHHAPEMLSAVQQAVLIQNFPCIIRIVNVHSTNRFCFQLDILNFTSMLSGHIKNSHRWGAQHTNLPVVFPPGTLANVNQPNVPTATVTCIHSCERTAR